MVTVFVLAGGKSSRMGADKAFMNGGVDRIRSIAMECGAERVITLCGAVERRHLFQGEVWPDPQCTHVFIDVGNHAEENCLTFGHPLRQIRFPIFFRAMIGTMGCIG